MTAPNWLPEFPFLQTQWSAIEGVTHRYPDLGLYDLQEDWDTFLAAYQARHTTVDCYAMLRIFRQSRLAYLAYQDLFLPVEQHLGTMHRVSALADLMIIQAHAMAAAEMSERYGQVVNAQGEVVELMVFSLGKLGTYELNYSSDVDLVFMYRSDGASNGRKSLPAAAYFVRLGQKIIKLLDHFTQDGQVYRVDMRLRPFGSAAPLVCTVAAFQQYLLYEGREWERFAWMRARMVGGEPSLQATVMRDVLPFIYRKHLDYAVFQSLAHIKTEIAGNLSFSHDDLKQGSGGIRAVEFIVQSLQMVFGGRNTQLQGNSISPQIKALAAARKLKPKEADLLHMAWLWLRKTENISQSVADQDTHEISDNGTVRQVLAEAFECVDWEDFKNKLENHRLTVSSLFAELFESSDAEESLLPEQQQTCQQLMAQLPVNRLPQDRSEQVEQLVRMAVSMDQPAVLQDFIDLVKKLLTRPSYLLMLQKESNVFRKVLQLLGQSPYFVNQLQAYPMLLEQLFEQHEAAIDSADELQVLWQSQAVQNDLEGWMEAIRNFKLAQQFNWIMGWVDQRVTRTQIGQQMTTLAQFILAEVVQYCFHEIAQKFPQISMTSDSLMVIAYGSAAVNDMTVGSDLDLVFLVDADLSQAEQQLFTQKWVKRVIHHLTSQMYHGKLYDLDMQLRPNGHSGPLVTTRKQFESYQLHEAWVWEHAAMVKSKLLVGTKQQRQWHKAFREQVLSIKRPAESVDQALQEMVEKLRHTSTGKSHDSEFAVLAGVLKHSWTEPELLVVSSLSELQQILLDKGLIDADKPKLLKHKKSPFD